MNMEAFKAIKAFWVGTFAFITAALGALAIPVYIMVGMNIIDYFSGILAAPRRGQKINSQVALYGITKKISMWILVLVGWIMDILLKYMIGQFGIGIQINFLIAAIVAVWIAINEIISVLENLKDLGAPVPEFMDSIMEHLKTEVEEITGEDEH